ncbi:hypothetical protein ACFQZ2_08200 [Streptomonospora algeriensis]|uniref:Uncharacterized protein n=1 Tax=Streptomonospora algeriensis TaxID=995084 RepID=A0ABW3BBH8_9ACTN
MPSITAGQSRLATIDRERLKNLLYGEPATEADRADLAEIALQTGHDIEDLTPATGEPGHDPRTGQLNPCAVYEPDVLAAEDALLADDEPDSDALWADGPLPGENLEDTVTRIGAARDIAAEQAAEIAADLVEVALEMPARARSLARCLRQRGILTPAPAGRTELAEVA